MASLPIPSVQQQAHCKELAELIKAKIKQADGWIDFATFMHMALYTPGLGYYSGGTKKFGPEGDFVTAPEISPLFAQTLARQVAQVLAETQGSILELGAGTGILAADLLLQLQHLTLVPKQYFILEVSDYLRQIQRETLLKKLPVELFNKLVWLETLPHDFVGLVLANEVLDAIPVHLIYNNSQDLYERGVAFDQEFVWQDTVLKVGDIYDSVKACSLTNDYLTEVSPAAAGLVASLANMLKAGVILMIDYGFSEREYYHPQRNRGTLMCHFQQHAHTNPLINVGLQDITAHVNFTVIANTGVAQGLVLLGYTTQASFLINCGILDLLSQVSAEDVGRYIPLAAATQKLLSPAEMGDLFKVIALSKNYSSDLLGFKLGDKAHVL